MAHKTVTELVSEWQGCNSMARLLIAGAGRPAAPYCLLDHTVAAQGTGRALNGIGQLAFNLQMYIN